MKLESLKDDTEQRIACSECRKRYRLRGGADDLSREWPFEWYMDADGVAVKDPTRFELRRTADGVQWRELGAVRRTWCTLPGGRTVACNDETCQREGPHERVYDPETGEEGEV